MKQPLFQRYIQLWHQLSLINGVICRTYCPSPTSENVTVLLIPPSLKQKVLHQAHNISSAGHQRYYKTLSRLKEEAYRLGMASSVQQYCQECEICQRSKPPSPVRAPLVNSPIGIHGKCLLLTSWKYQCHKTIIAIYLLSWIILPSGLTPFHFMIRKLLRTIADAVIKVCSSIGMPDILHSGTLRAPFHQVLQYISKFFSQCIFGNKESYLVWDKFEQLTQ